jgi:hypothetical protein
MKKPSSLTGFITKMGEYGKQLNDKLTELGEKAGEYKDKASETVFGKKDPDAEPTKPGMLSNLVSGTVGTLVNNPLTRGVASAGNYAATKSLGATLAVSDRLIS